MMFRASVCLFTCCLFAAIACRSEKDFTTKSQEQSTNDLKFLSKELGVPIPADAKVLGVHRESGMDDLTCAKFLITRQAFVHVAAILPVRPEAFRPGVGRLGSDFDFWNPHATPGLRWAQAPLPDARSLTIGIADSTDGVILFLVNHGT
jgi:hypothetical protein